MKDGQHGGEGLTFVLDISNIIDNLFLDNALDLDSLDALQISMAIQKRYGVRMPDSKETRRALASFATLAEHLHKLKA